MQRPSGSEQALLQAVKRSLPAQMPPLDARTLAKYKEKALARAREKAQELREQVGVSAKEGLQQARAVARDVASSRSTAEAGTKLLHHARRAAESPWVKALARLLICLYFVNTVYDAYIRWQFMQQPENKIRAAKWPSHYPSVRFPYFGVAVLLPCALLAAAGFKVLATGAVLVVFEVFDSASLIWAQLSMLLLYGYKPNELVVKRLAIMGCVALVLANSVQERHLAMSSYAGLLVSSDKKETSRRKSTVLLLGRLLLCALFIYVGIVQIQRVVARDWVLFARIPHSQLWAKDGHDNNWLLLEFLFSLPFAVGWKTALFARLLALTMGLEAVTCWPFWATWPTWAYAAHVRLHFVTNLAVAGGLLLLANFGAGQFTVDTLLEKKKS